MAGIPASLLRLDEVYSNLIFAISAIALVMASASGRDGENFGKSSVSSFSSGPPPIPSI